MISATSSSPDKSDNVSAHIVCTLVNVNKKNRRVNALALIDTGNSIGGGGVAMSGSMAEKLGLKPTGRQISVGTASARGRMTSAGNVKFELCIPGLPRFVTRAIVFPTLQSDVNLGLQFLVNQKLQLDLSVNPIRLHIRGQSNGGHAIMSVSGGKVRKTVKICSSENVSIPAGDVKYVKVTGLPEDRHLWQFFGRSERCMHSISGTYAELEVPVRNPGDRLRILTEGEELGEGRRLPTLPPTIQSAEEESQELQDLYNELKLDENKLLQAHPGLLQETKKVIARHRGVFSGPGNRFGVTDMMECDLQSKPGAKPVRQCVRRLNPDLMANLKAQLDEWLEAGLVEPSNSPWATPLHPVYKNCLLYTSPSPRD